MNIKDIPIAKIKRAKYNPRVLLKPGDAGYERLSKRLTKFGLVRPLVWNEKSGNLIEGHQRLTILEARGDKLVKCSVLNLSLKDEKLLNLALNSHDGEWDDDLLKTLLQDLDKQNADMDLTGLSEKDLARMLNPLDPTGDPQSIGKMGDLEYRILVSCTSEQHQAELLEKLEAMFDCPVSDKARLTWTGDFPFEAAPWSVGLIVGPSGSGKSTILREVFGDTVALQWKAKSVLDDFNAKLSMTQISEICRAVGFNTVPAWMRPYSVLSNGERFRVDMARRLAEVDGLICVDEFTSVVDRQVAQIGSHAVQKFVRKNNKQFVAATCHYDVTEFLQPDWILEPATMTFTRRALRRRPAFDITVSQVPYSTWSVFAPFHYMSAELNHAARCFGLFVGDQIASFCAILHQPHARVKNLKRVSRVVTHPDWQGIGLGPVLIERVASAYRALNVRFRNYPAHPSYIRTIQADPNWVMTKRAGTFGPTTGSGSGIRDSWAHQGARPCAVFEYVGAAMKIADARKLIGVTG